jgi:hypothetical protein
MGGNSLTQLATAIRVLSKGKYTVGPEGTVTSEDLAALEGLLAGDIELMNPGFTGEALIRFKAYFVLDTLDTASGDSMIIQKMVKDVNWKVKPSKSSSIWMDKVFSMITLFKNYVRNDTAYAGVVRADSEMKRLQFDNTGSPQYGNPSKEEW